MEKTRSATSAWTRIACSIALVAHRNMGALSPPPTEAINRSLAGSGTTERGTRRTEFGERRKCYWQRARSRPEDEGLYRRAGIRLSVLLRGEAAGGGFGDGIHLRRYRRSQDYVFGQHFSSPGCPECLDPDARPRAHRCGAVRGGEDATVSRL